MKNFRNPPSHVFLNKFCLILTALGLVFISNPSIAQKQAYNWHFGNRLQLDFSSGSPVFVPGSSIYAAEGSASYSDKNGNLLFYTSGDTFIYNANHQVMFDMQNTGGNFSSMQSSVIIEAPCEPGKYYLFTMDGIDATANNNGLSYFKIDMSLNAGLGGVVQPGISVYANSVEGLHAIRHKNQTDYWILINHTGIGLGVYKVTSSGVALNGVFNYPPFGTKRIIKASPDGSKVFVIPDPDGSASGQSSTTGILFQFDNATGTLSNPQVLTATTYTNPSSTSGEFNYYEFSPNSRYLYIATSNSIQRFDLQNNQTTATVLFDFFEWTFSAAISQLQLGPDGNIYFCFFGQLTSNGQLATALSRIRCPNNIVPTVERLLPVPNEVFFLGMPNFPAWLFESYDSTYVSLGPDTLFLCDNNGSVTLNALNPGATYLWSTGSTAQTITVSTPGTYSVVVNGACGTGRDTIVIFDCYGEILTTQDFCDTDSVPFSVLSSQGITSIEWNFGDAASGNLNTSSLVNTEHSFSGSGTFTISAIVRTACSTDTLFRTISFGGYNSSINTSSCGDYISPWGTVYSQSGTYINTAINSNGCDSTITLNLTINDAPTVNINTQTSLCSNSSGSATANINGGTPGFTYLWTPGNANTPNITGISAGNYSVLITDSKGCTASASAQVSQINGPAVAATSSASGCDNASGRAFATANAGTPPYSFSWFPSGGNSSTADSLPSGSYLITVTDANNCTAQANTVVNLAGGNQIEVNVLDVTVTPGDTVLLQATGASTYAWSPPEGLSCTNCANPVATPLVTTLYTVTGIDSLQCKSSALVKIQVEEPCGEVFFPTVFSPDNKGPAKNETLCAYGNCITELTYEIFNRWGQRVFRSNSVNDCWDGIINGVAAEPGAYAFRASYTLRNGNSKEVYGSLLLIR